MQDSTTLAPAPVVVCRVKQTSKIRFLIHAIDARTLNDNLELVTMTGQVPLEETGKQPETSRTTDKILTQCVYKYFADDSKESLDTDGIGTLGHCTLVMYNVHGIVTLPRTTRRTECNNQKTKRNKDNRHNRM